MRTHGRTFFGYRETFRHSPTQLSPELKAKIDSMLAIISNAGGDVEKAAESERRIIEELRQTGNEVFTVGPAVSSRRRKRNATPSRRWIARKKSSAGTPDWEKSKLGEQIFTQGRGGPQIRPFAESAPVECRGYSEALQRVMTDFGANDAFAGAAAKLKEHYGIEVAVGAVRGSTEEPGGTMRAETKISARLAADGAAAGWRQTGYTWNA
jgi:hypothetical protein